MPVLKVNGKEKHYKYTTKGKLEYLADKKKDDLMDYIDKKKKKKKKKKSAHGDYGQIPTGDGTENPIGGN